MEAQLKKVSKKIILNTGGSGVLGSYFRNKFKNKYKIICFPYRLEQFNKLEKWIKNENFDYFVHFAAITAKIKKNDNKINLINKEIPIKIIKLLQKNSIKNLKYFLFFSISHVYGYYKKMEKTKSANEKSTKIEPTDPKTAANTAKDASKDTEAVKVNGTSAGDAKSTSPEKKLAELSTSESGTKKIAGAAMEEECDQIDTGKAEPKPPAEEKGGEDEDDFDAEDSDEDDDEYDSDFDKVDPEDEAVKEGDEEDFDLDAYLKWRQQEGAEGAAEGGKKGADDEKDPYDDEADDQ